MKTALNPTCGSADIFIGNQPCNLFLLTEVTGIAENNLNYFVQLKERDVTFGRIEVL